MLTSIKDNLVDYDYNQGLNWLMDSLETDWAAGSTYITLEDVIIDDPGDLTLEPILLLRSYARYALKKDLKKVESLAC